MQKNDKGFFLSETMVVIAVVAVVLLGVFKIFTSTYTNYKEKENYNTVNAINAASTLQKYYSTIGLDYSTVIGDSAYVELTNIEQYNSNYYNDLKETLEINRVYLINMEKIYQGTNLSSLNLPLRKYINTLKSYSSQYVIIAVVNDNEFASISSSVDYDSILVGDPEDEYSVTVLKGTTFVDPGYTNWEGGEPLIEWETPLDTNVPGTYYIHYDFNGYVLRRKVVVIDSVYNYVYDADIPFYTFTAPITGYYEVELWGAQGGSTNSSTWSGNGAYTKGIISLNENEKIYVYIGGSGKNGTNGAATLGGYNGGGSALGNSDGNNGSGGGATDVRYFGDIIPTTSELAENSTLGLNSRIMVAGGGGGVVTPVTAYGNGGGLIADSAIGPSSSTAQGGTQLSGGTSSGTFGQGGNGGTSNRAGGGGGYYGGGTISYAGAGGSSYISGYAGVVSGQLINDSFVEPASLTSNQQYSTLHYSGKYFIGGEMQAGVNAENGRAKITWISEEEPTRTNTDLNNVQYVKNCTRGSSTNTNNHPVELQVIFEGVNIAYGIAPTSSTTLSSGSYITDGKIDTSQYATNGTGEQCIIVDLGTNLNNPENGLWDLDEVATWQYYGTAGRIFYDNYTSVSADGTTWRQVISTGSRVPTSQGERVNAWEGEGLYKNLIRNGSFTINEVYGWNSNNIIGTITSTGLYINDTSTSSNYWNYYYAYSFNSGDIYYAAIDNKTISGSAFSFAIRKSNGSWRTSIDTSVSPDYKIYSLRFTGDSTDLGIQLGSGGSTISTSYTKNVRLYNLTEIYGAGNEPSIEWCDENLTSVYGIWIIS